MTCKQQQLSRAPKGGIIIIVDGVEKFYRGGWFVPQRGIVKTAEPKTVYEIAAAINAAGEKYYGDSANAWVCDKFARIYFGRDFVTIENDGEIHNRKNGRARACTIGDTAVEIVEAYV